MKKLIILTEVLLIIHFKIMQEDLKNILTNLSTSEFSEAVHAVSLAYNTRTKMKDNQITLKELSEKLKISQEEMFDFLCGVHDFGFSMITKVELALTEIIDKKNDKFTLDDLLKMDEERKKEAKKTVVA